ncbi:hypothetical protein JW949_00445 [Candidatus Woesearchaeota archaeon]|nr:hypothetical protein [Candidatus Woesearchaeota archaeon]
MEDLTERLKKNTEEKRKKLEEKLNKTKEKFSRIPDKIETEYIKLTIGILGSFAATSPGLDWLPGPDWLYVLGAFGYSAKKIYDINNYHKEKNNPGDDKNG